MRVNDFKTARLIILIWNKMHINKYQDLYKIKTCTLSDTPG